MPRLRHRVSAIASRFRVAAETRWRGSGGGPGTQGGGRGGGVFLAFVLRWLPASPPLRPDFASRFRVSAIASPCRVFYFQLTISELYKSRKPDCRIFSAKNGKDCGSCGLDPQLSMTVRPQGAFRPSIRSIVRVPQSRSTPERSLRPDSH
jgi:hypothetical protein